MNSPMNWKEIVSRVVMVVFAAGLGVAATFLVLGGRGSLDYSLPMALLLFIAGGFLYLIAGTLFCFAFLPSHDTLTGPPRGFTVVSAVFDGFWEFVEYVLRATGRY